MDDLRFEWDEAKSEANRRKHGIDFEEASTVFADERALLIDDPDHSEEEDRFILLGLSAILRLLVVCHCYRTDDSIIRIISARKATTSASGPWNVTTSATPRLIQVLRVDAGIDSSGNRLASPVATTACLIL